MDPFLCLRRGVSGYYRWNGLLRRLFSAYAEVFREAIDSSLSATAFLCLRRGVSVNSDPTEYTAHFSLPTQRCFSLRSQRSVLWCAFLCLRRGVSRATAFAVMRGKLFSAYAEVFLLHASFSPVCRTFLCLRRGVSICCDKGVILGVFSLPTQRCFQGSASVRTRKRLFSAYAEVFLPLLRLFPRLTPFLCLRRGVSFFSRRSCCDLTFSLPTQRCFPCIFREKIRNHLFSAYAEVFPSLALGERLMKIFSLPTQRCF